MVLSLEEVIIRHSRETCMYSQYSTRIPNEFVPIEMFQYKLSLAANKGLIKGKQRQQLH